MARMKYNRPQFEQTRYRTKYGFNFGADTHKPKPYKGFKARYPGKCHICEEPFFPGNEIGSLLFDGKRKYCHASCIVGGN